MRPLVAVLICGTSLVLAGCSAETPSPSKSGPDKGAQKTDLGGASSDPNALEGGAKPATTGGATKADGGAKPEGGAVPAEPEGPAFPTNPTPSKAAGGKTDDLDSLLEGDKKGTADTEKGSAEKK